MMEEANAYREQVVATADGEADRFKRLLAEYEKAPEVTRERLYLDAIQTVMSNTNKVLVDVEGGNNVLYLPLDKLAPASDASRQSAGGSSRSGLSESALRQITERVTEELLREINNNDVRRGGR